MRQIKYRGRRIDNGEWVYGSFMPDYIHHNSGASIVQGGCVLFEVDPETVGQFTGLVDRNGKEIYEGDLISITNPYSNRVANGAARVVFSHGYAGGWVATVDDESFLNIGTRTDYVAVVGNIHETEKEQS